MSGADSDEARADELTARYRAASAADPARPGDSVRESILAYARDIAAARARRGSTSARQHRPAANDPRWRITAAASVLVAGFATFLAWHFHAPAPAPTLGSSPSQSRLAANNPPAPEYTASDQPSEPSPADRPASALPAPNAVTTRSRQRASAPAHAPSAPRDAAADLRVAENATPGSSTNDAARARENSVAAAQFAPSAAAAPPNVQALRAPAPDALASARTSAAPNSPWVAAVESGSLERVDRLLRSGISIEQTDARGRTALLIATLRGDTAMVRHLLAAGARADAADDSGDTPLAAAQRQGRPELLRLLEHASHP